MIWTHSTARCLTTLLATTCALAASSLGAQTGQAGTSIPLRLVRALLETDPSMSAAGSPELTIGSAPAIVTSELNLPAGSEILGSITYGQTTDLLALVPMNRDSARVAIERSMVAKGWHHPVRPVMRGGLQFNPPAAALGWLCKGTDGYAMVRTARHQGTEASSDVRVTFQNQSASCSDRTLDRMTTMASIAFMDPLMGVPPLYMPAGAAPESCGTMGSDIWMDQKYQSSLEPTELLASYARQFEAASWHSAGIPDIRATSFAGTDSTGKSRRATLMVLAPHDKANCYTVVLSVPRS